MAADYMKKFGVDLDDEMSKVQFGDETSKQAPSSSKRRDSQTQTQTQEDLVSLSLTRIVGVRLPRKPPSTFWDISISEGKISSIDPHHPAASNESYSPGVLNATGRLLAPSLCHAHIHVDKCFLLQDPKYSDLEIINGDFQEAMTLTSEAKSRFDEDDLLRRGRQLIEESIASGVTAMRAFVEVDGGVMFKCLDAGLHLRNEFAERCEVQICAFAQDPLFSGPDGGEQNRKLMADAAKREGVEVLGSTPYVEQDEVKSKMNVQWTTSQALSNGKALDLHLDYHLDERKEPIIWSLLEILKKQNWNQRGGKGITLGHCTRFTMFKDEDWKRLKEEVGDLPIPFVGLPTSDLFMMRTESRVRGSLHVPEMIERHGLEAAIAANNVGNAFTPQGNCDPLSVASLGVALYHAGTRRDADILYECVSSRAKAAIGLQPTSLDLSAGEPADFVIFGEEKAAWRTRKSIAEVVYDAGGGRQTVKGGLLTS